MFYIWPEKIAAELMKRKVEKHVVHGMWTPSGFFHIGNARTELFTPQFVYEAIKDKGMKAEFNFIVDDFDDFDKIPAGLDLKEEKFSSFLGKPLVDVPSPFPGFDSWPSFFVQEIKEACEKFEIRPRWFSAYECYKKGFYDEAIKIVLNSAKKVREIWEKIAGKKAEDLPVMVICENCGRSATTFVREYDGKFLSYECKKEREYCKPCGYAGKIKPEKGKAKLPWRLHWPATWYIFGTTFESGGKDHFTPGGSVDTGKAFMKEIFSSSPPFLVGIEFVQIGGAKISGSVGNVISMKDWLEIAEQELLRFMFVEHSPSSVIDFDLGKNFFLLSERYYRAERIYYEKEKAKNEKKTEQLKRQYKFATKKLQKEMPIQLNYSLASTLVQVYPKIKAEELAEILFSIGYTKRKKLSNFEKERIEKRLSLAKNWLAKYASKEEKIILKPRKIKLEEKEKNAVSELAKELEKEIKAEELQTRIYDIARKNDIEPKEFFILLYKILLGKESGPKLGPFILAVGREKIREILKAH